MSATHPTTAWSPDTERFTVLDSWRGIAALLVAWGHIEGSAWFLDNAVHARSGLAVDFFFVLSGFVITAGYGERLRRGFAIRTFMFLRIARLWPLHAAVVAMFVALELAFLAVGELGFLSGREPFGEGRELATLPATLLLLQAYLHPGQHPWSVASWSISVELGLYLLAAMLFALGRGRAWALGLAIAAAAGTVLMLRLGPGWSDVLRGLLGFGLGMACYRLWTRLRDVRPSPATASALEFAATAAIIACLALPVPLPLVALVFAAAIVTFAAERGLVSRVLLRPGFVWLGAISYSIYLIHGMVIGRAFDAIALAQSRTGVRIADAALGGADRLTAPGWLSAAVVAAMLAGTIAAAAITWRWIEEPSRKWSKARVRPASTAPAPTGAAAGQSGD